MPVVAETKQGTCPGGHILPHKTSRGQCTSLYCAEIAPTEKKVDITAIEKAKLANSLANPLDEIDKDANIRQKAAEARLRVRRKAVPIPEGLDGALAEEWADRELVNLLPVAVANLKHDLLYGDERARSEATDKVLRANGRSQRESLTGGGQTIILNIGSNPWKKEKVIDAEINTGKAKGS